MKNLLIILFVMGSMICTGQEENQKSFQNSIAIGAGIGYIVNYSNSNRYGLTYQRELKNNWRLQASLYTERAGEYYAPLTHYSVDSSIVDIIYISSFTNRQLKFGGVKTVFEKFFVGADLSIGYGRNSSRQYYNTYNYHHDSWNHNYEVNEGDTLEYIGFSHMPVSRPIVNSDQHITRYLLYGLSLNIGLQLPIYNHWDLVLQYSPQFLMGHRLGYKGNGFEGGFILAAELMLRFKF